MLIAVDALNKHLFQPLLDDMFRLRARVFADRMQWEVKVVDGKEIDEFDALDPAYLIGVDDHFNVISCARLLQTTGPHMLVDVFHDILDGEPPLRSATIWESTRFCVDTERLARNPDEKALSKATCELIIALNDYGQKSGISDIITVIDPVMNRVLKRSNCAPYDYIGKTVPMGRVKAMAALLDCTDERGKNVRDFSGITWDVFLSDEEAYARLMFKKRLESIGQYNQALINDKTLIDYFMDQFCAASEPVERQAVVEMLERVEDGLISEKMQCSTPPTEGLLS